MPPAATARAVAERVFAEDRLARLLGMRLEAAAPGSATVSMTVVDDLTQGHGSGHGGAIFALADIAFACACNSHNERAVAQHCSISFIAPTQVGNRLTATAVEKSRRGRSGLYDIAVSGPDGVPVAEFRGHSRTIGGTWID